MTGIKWLKVFFISIFIVLNIVALVNYLVDPLWNFSHQYFFNSKQDGFDERQQKLNFINTHGLKEYDSLLLGSSRATYINQNDFKEIRVFNHSVSSMMPFEYSEYIKFDKSIKGKDFKYIILGLDFFGTNKYMKKDFKSPVYYIDKCNNLSYKYKTLYSIFILKKSFKNIKNIIYDVSQYYNRSNRKFHKKISNEERSNNYNRHIKIHINQLSGENYAYSKNYKKLLQQLKLENPKSKFIIFTPPVTSGLLQGILYKANRKEEYKRWITEVIEVFGEVYHFMTINTITSNIDNYIDDDHCYPHIYRLLVQKLLSNTTNKKIPSNFGIKLNGFNVEDYLDTIK